MYNLCLLIELYWFMGESVNYEELKSNIYIYYI